MNIENTTWTAIVKCQAIFEALIKNGEEHFSHASHTPFASGLVADIPGPFEFNEVSQQILRGKFDIDSISDDIQLHSIIKAMSHSDPTNPIKADSKLMINLELDLWNQMFLRPPKWNCFCRTQLIFLQSNSVSSCASAALFLGILHQ
jgi:hypothetical protein